MALHGILPQAFALYTQDGDTAAQLSRVRPPFSSATLSSTVSSSDQGDIQKSNPVSFCNLEWQEGGAGTPGMAGVWPAHHHCQGLRVMGEELTRELGQSASGCR